MYISDIPIVVVFILPAGIQKLEASLQTTSKALDTFKADLKNMKEERDGLQKQVLS